MEDLATHVAPIQKRLAPDSFANMTVFERQARDCRIGRNRRGRPYSGVTTVVDYCAHAHRSVWHKNIIINIILFCFEGSSFR